MPCSHHDGPGLCTYCFPFCKTCHKRFCKCDWPPTCEACGKAKGKCAHIWEQYTGKWDGFGN